jgi:hypothetical protein
LHQQVMIELRFLEIKIRSEKKIPCTARVNRYICMLSSL